MAFIPGSLRELLEDARSGKIGKVHEDMIKALECAMIDWQPVAIENHDQAVRIVRDLCSHLLLSANDVLVTRRAFWIVAIMCHEDIAQKFMILLRTLGSGDDSLTENEAKEPTTPPAMGG